MKSLKEKCGVVGAWNIDEAAHITYLSLFALQHRGQEGAGIISSAENESFRGHRDQGLVSNVFNREKLATLQGNAAIGHVRYSTAGGSFAKNLQPLWVKTNFIEVALAHNGNLTNADDLRKNLELEGSVFQTDSDTEVILHLLMRQKGEFIERLKKSLAMVKGAYSLVILVRENEKRKLYAVKDPFGFRPLVLGKRGAGTIVASETCAFDLVDAEFVRELKPGEILEISDEGIKEDRLTRVEKPAPCVFEWIYFSRPDSVVFDRSVYEMRKKMGELLAEEDLRQGLKADLVMGVPDSGIPAAIGYAAKFGVPFEMGLIRNHYIGRTFIEPHQSIRDFSVKIKQNPLRGSLVGKSVVVVDDSIVRGTTSKKINQFLREAGAKEIHMRISAPPTVSPCYYGIDTPHKNELIGGNKSVDEICKFIVADSLRYLDLKELYQKIEAPTRMCDACFTKNYPEARSATDIVAVP